MKVRMESTHSAKYHKKSHSSILQEKATGHEKQTTIQIKGVAERRKGGEGVVEPAARGTEKAPPEAMPG